MFIMEYVLGFAFDLNGDVTLIRKNRPEWQAGKWNGVGGHRNGAETGPEAMVREFEEEAGVKTHPEQWRLAGSMRADGAWRVLVYTCTERLWGRVVTKTDERVALFGTPLQCEGIFPYIENVPALVELCSLARDHTDKIPLFELDYTPSIKDRLLEPKQKHR